MKPLLFQHLSSLVLILIWIYQTLGTGHWFLTACFTAVFVILFLWKQFFFLIKNDESILHENQLKLLQESLNRLLHFNEAEAEDLCFHSLVLFFFSFCSLCRFFAAVSWLNGLNVLHLVCRWSVHQKHGSRVHGLPPGHLPAQHEPQCVGSPVQPGASCGQHRNGQQLRRHQRLWVHSVSYWFNARSRNNGLKNDSNSAGSSCFALRWGFKWACN